MNVKKEIENYLQVQPELKRNDLNQLHKRILELSPDAKLWFLDGKNSEGKIVSNPSIGYGSRANKYADGTSTEFYQVGISANSTGISVYILGIEDKSYLAKTYAKDLGKASITGYCIKFKKLSDINFDILIAMIRYGFEHTTTNF